MTNKYYALVCLLAVAACDPELPDDEPTGSVRGSVTYDGTAHEAFARPALSVAAFFAWPPQAPPNSMVMIETDELPGTVDYELRDLAPHDYFVVAQVIDLDDQGAVSVPTGSFPNFCALTEADGTVTVRESDAVESVDITVYDSAGADDPCGADTTSCPGDGQATMRLTLNADVSNAPIESADVVSVGLFETWPPNAPPVVFSLVTSDNIEFPLSVVVTTVPAGDLYAYACLDRGGDNSFETCSDDPWAVQGGGTPVTFDAGKIVTLEFDLDAGSSASPVVEDALDCP